MFGFDVGPHSTTVNGVGVRVSDAYELAIIESNAAFHGCAPALTCVRTKLSWAWLTSTPGWVKTAGAADAAGAGPTWPVTTNAAAATTTASALDPRMAVSPSRMDPGCSCMGTESAYMNVRTHINAAITNPVGLTVVRSGRG